MSKLIYAFNDENSGTKDLLGGKGANLAEMTRLGLPVPDGFTITTKACNDYLASDESLTSELLEELSNEIMNLEERTGKRFSDEKDLLLVSVRSGAKFSMPGMMDTILNLGLNDENVKKLAQKTGDARFAYDCYRRLLQMFGEVVYGIHMSRFDTIFNKYKEENNYNLDTDIPADVLKEIVEEYKEIYVEEIHKSFPDKPIDQLTEAVEAVFKSWNNERARIYRDLHDIPHNLGTAVNIQEMVFGNSGEDSGTGVLFTRNPSTGEHKLYGEYLLNAQGEDVVAGIRTPKEIAVLEEQMPGVYKELVRLTEKLESHYKEMQDIEFTIEDEKLYILQTRNGKRTARAAVKIAYDMVKDNVISKKDAIMMVDPKSIDQLLHPQFDEKALQTAELISKGLPASPGAATGMVVFSTEKAKELGEAGEKVILVRPETSPEDIEGMIVSEAIVTTHGGMTSHAAVVARGMGTCCVTAVADLKIDTLSGIATYASGDLKEGDIISVNGSTGKLYLGVVDKIEQEQSTEFAEFMTWAKEIANMDIRMNAETTVDINAGYGFDASGIGLVRTEHMFFQEERLIGMRRFILAQNHSERVDVLDTILEYQQEDFEHIFRLTGERPVIVRLLDPPLHEFLPHSASEIEGVANQLGVSKELLKSYITNLQEVNPMLGHRGCRLAITYPELYEMQTEAMIRSLIKLKEEGINCNLEIMVPLIVTVEEYKTLRDKIRTRAESLEKEAGVKVNYTIGVMIETPRACLTADEIVKEADFFSFGTNDLTQLTFGFSRDDAGKFIGEYVDRDLMETDPFQSIDKNGVGELVKIAVEKARAYNPNFKIGVCGELGGDPRSIEFFNELDMTYVSCSPYRVPGAMLAAAQSVVKNK